MDGRIVNRQGFTLLEVTFATGILFLTFALLVGALAQLASLREMAERRQLAVLCLSHCAEQVRAQPADDLSVTNLKAPEGIPGEYDIRVEPLADPDFPGVVRLTVTTRTSRGHEIVVSALCKPGGIGHGA